MGTTCWNMAATGTQKYDALPQVLSSLAVSSCAVIVGGWLSFSSVALPKMISESENFNQTKGLAEDLFVVDLHVGSWIVSLFFLGTIVGCLAGGPMNQLLGPRRIFLYCAPISSLTWVMIAISHRVWVVYLSGLLSGVLFGIFQANAKVYNAEISHPDLRGSLGAMISNMLALGTVFTFILGYFISSWRLIAWVLILPSLILGVAVFFVPDSPYWLLERGREEEAKKSLSRLRGKHNNIEIEFVEMLKKKRAKDPNQSVISILFSNLFFQPFIRLGSLMVITQWAGINVVASYMVNIFQDSGISLSPEVAPILVSVMQLSLSMVSTLILRVAPRKPLFLVCAFLILLGQLTLGTHAYLTEDLSKDAASSYGWIPVLAVATVQSSQTVGFMAVIQLLVAESFPTQIRSYSSGICGSMTAVNQFGATKLYPYFLDQMGFAATFWLYAGVMLVLIIYAAFSIPENKGESLVKTEDKMAGVGKETENHRNAAFEEDTNM